MHAESPRTGCTDLDCCCDPSAADGNQDGVAFGDQRLDPVQQAVGADAFKLLLESGQPVTMASIAEAASVDLVAAIEVLGGFARTGNVSMKGEQVVGITGLSVEPTRHRIELDFGRRWTWCALDAVGIVDAIGDGVIHSEMVEGHVRLQINGGEVESNDLAVFVAEGDGMTSAIDQWCPVVNFFPSSASATGWAAERGVAGRPVLVAKIASQLIERWRSVLNYHQAR